MFEQCQSFGMVLGGCYNCNFKTKNKSNFSGIISGKAICSFMPKVKLPLSSIPLTAMPLKSRERGNTIKITRSKNHTSADGVMLFYSRFLALV